MINIDDIIFTSIEHIKRIKYKDFMYCNVTIPLIFGGDNNHRLLVLSLRLFYFFCFVLK